MAVKIKTIRGRGYFYDDVSARVAGKVVTKSKYLGAVNPKRKGLTLGTILGGLLQASAQSFAPKHAPKEHHSRARAPDPRSQAAERERWVAFVHNDPKAAIADLQARARTAAVGKPETPVNVEEVQAWKDFGERVAAAQTAREAPAAPTPETSTPAHDSAPVAGEAPESGETA